MTRRPHPDWCARGHHCGLGEHRAAPIAWNVPGAGTAVLTRVLTANGIEHLDVRLSITLPGNEAHARQRFTAVLTHLKTLIGPARLVPGPRRSGRAA